MNLRDLIASDVASDIAEQPKPVEMAAAPQPEPEAAPAEVVALQQPAAERRSAPRGPKVAPLTPKPRAGEGNIKQRATQMTLYLEPPAYDQLRELAFTERTKMHPLILEAIDLLFRKRGLKSLAELQR